MRLIFSLFTLLAFVMPSMAAENSDAPKTTLVKGSKSYQVRYTTSAKSLESIEPAAGAEIDPPNKNDTVAITSSQDDVRSKKVIKLHNRK